MHSTAEKYIYCPACIWYDDIFSVETFSTVSICRLGWLNWNRPPRFLNIKFEPELFLRVMAWFIKGEVHSKLAIFFFTPIESLYKDMLFTKLSASNEG